VSARHGTGLASMVVFPAAGALHLAGMVESVPYALVAGVSGLLLAFALFERVSPARPPVSAGAGRTSYPATPRAPTRRSALSYH
jgi:hypothetical protein